MADEANEVKHLDDADQGQAGTKDQTKERPHTPARKARIVRDPVWGDIDVTDRVLLCIIDHPLLQRLRRIRCLGLGSEEFPSTHLNHFGHTLGAIHVASLYFRGSAEDHEWWHLEAGGSTQPLSGKQLAPFLTACQSLFHHLLTPPFSHSSQKILFDKMALNHTWRESARRFLIFKIVYDLVEQRGPAALEALFPVEQLTFGRVDQWINVMAAFAHSTYPGDETGLVSALESFDLKKGDLLDDCPIWRIPYAPGLLDSIARVTHYAGTKSPIDSRAVVELWRASKSGKKEQEESITRAWEEQSHLDVLFGIHKLLNLTYLRPSSEERSAALMHILREDGELKSRVSEAAEAVSKAADATEKLLADRADLHASDVGDWRVLKQNTDWTKLAGAAQKVWCEFDDYTFYARLKELGLDNGALTPYAAAALGFLDPPDELQEQLKELREAYRKYRVEQYVRLLLAKDAADSTDKADGPKTGPAWEGLSTSLKALGDPKPDDTKKVPTALLALDPIHGPIRVDPIFEPLLRTWPLQRLRYIKQLEFVDSVFPGACHCRYEHSLGVAYLARRLAQRQGFHKPISRRWEDYFNETSIPQFLEIKKILGDPGRWPQKMYVDLMFLAGLVHDVGHGPLSHLSEEVTARLIGKADKPLIPGLAPDNGLLPVAIHEWLGFVLLAWDSVLPGLLQPSASEVPSEGKISNGAKFLQAAWPIELPSDMDDAKKSAAWQGLVDCLNERTWLARRTQLKEAFRELVDRVRVEDRWDAARRGIQVEEVDPDQEASSLRFLLAAMIVGALPLTGDFLHGQYDVDRADYLQRDAVHAGVEYGRFDIARLFGPGLRLPEQTGTGAAHDRENPRAQPTIDYIKGLVALETMQIGRDQMYFTVFYHPTSLLTAEALYERGRAHWSSRGKQQFKNWHDDIGRNTTAKNLATADAEAVEPVLGPLVGGLLLMGHEDFDCLHELRREAGGNGVSVVLNRAQARKAAVLPWELTRPDYRTDKDNLQVALGEAAKAVKDALKRWLDHRGSMFVGQLQRIFQQVSTYAPNSLAQDLSNTLSSGKFDEWFQAAYSPQSEQMELKILVSRKHLSPVDYIEWSYASEVSPYLQAMGPAHRRNRILCIGLRPEIGRLLDDQLATDLGVDEKGAEDIETYQKSAREELRKGIHSLFGNRDITESALAAPGGGKGQEQPHV